MLERFTKPARSIVEAATRIASESTASQVRPEHLFAGLLEDEECVAVRVLGDLGADLDRLRAELSRRRLRYVDGLDADDAEALASIGIDLDEVVRRIDRHLGGRGGVRRRPRFGRDAKKVLELALREAVALHHGYIGTEHLLLGLVRGGDRVVVDTLDALGITLRALRPAVVEATRRAG
jgi:ATP-dependent Clp protease ATP-binding subunit ClpA